MSYVFFIVLIKVHNLKLEINVIGETPAVEESSVETN